MLITPQNLSLTLFVSVLISLAVVSVEAHDFAQSNRRDHDNLKRLVRKRSPTPQIDLTGGKGLAAVANNPNDPNNPDNTGSASASPSASASNATDSASAASISASASASASQSASASASASSSASASAASVSATSSSAASTTPAQPQTTVGPQTPDTPATPTAQEKSTITNTKSVLADAAETNTSPPKQQEATSTKKSMITTILIVVAASVGGIVILWTIFRKWKLAHSSKFDERMAPIDWQPTADDGIVPAHRRANSRASSFNSSSIHDNARGAAYNDRLEHDFTAAPTTLAPVGGYADLARGPSPQPQMQDLSRGPSMRSYGSTARPAYDTGVPLHHQAGYGQAEAYDYNGDAIRF